MDSDSGREGTKDVGDLDTEMVGLTFRWTEEKAMPQMGDS